MFRRRKKKSQWSFREPNVNYSWYPYRINRKSFFETTITENHSPGMDNYIKQFCRKKKLFVDSLFVFPIKCSMYWTWNAGIYAPSNFRKSLTAIIFRKPRNVASSLLIQYHGSIDRWNANGFIYLHVSLYLLHLRHV